MSKPKVKKWDNITDLTEKWVKSSYPNASVMDSWKYKDRMNNFLAFLGLTDKQFIESYKRTKDRIEWSRNICFKVVAFYNQRLQEGYSTNTARAEASTIRAFCRDNATTLILPRKKIAKPKIATGEHEYTKEELGKMYQVGDIRDKAILTTAISLGFSVEDFAGLRRDFLEPIVNKAIDTKTDFIGFTYERGKTGVMSRSHLTPEARDSLKAWFTWIDKKREKEHKPKAQWVWSNGNGKHLTNKAMNDIIKNLTQKANISTIGTTRFHLLRKFLMSALSDANFNEFEIKRCVGKEIPSSDSTYLQHLDKTVDNKFGEVYGYIRLNGSSQNHTRIEELEAKIITLEQKNEDQAIEIETLKRIIEYSIPKAKVQDAIRKLAKENDLNISEFVGRDYFKTSISLSQLITAIAKAKKEQSQQETEKHG
jgi:site-specific recombinase XerD